MKDPETNEAAVGQALSSFVEAMGDHLEASGMARGAGRMLAWLLVCDPEHQSAEQLADALQASGGGVSTNARLLILSGFAERARFPGDRRTYYRARPHAYEAALADAARGMGRLRQLSEQGLQAVSGGSPERGERLRQLRHLAGFMETEMADMHGRYRSIRQEQDHE